VPARLLHHSTVVSIQGEGYRLKDKRRAGLIHLPAGGVASRSTNSGEWTGSLEGRYEPHGRRAPRAPRVNTNVEQIRAVLRESIQRREYR
jgi:hypothetical protein